MRPPHPPNEAERLEILSRYRILDTAPEPAFDRLTRLASKLFQAPIALVTLIDAGRQWFKSRVGLDLRETARDEAFCAYTILGEDILVVPDATQDERFRANPLVTGPPHVRFYAGVSLRTAEGVNLGTFAIMDTRPRDLGPEERELLADLAGIAADEIQLRVAFEQRMEPSLRELAESVHQVCWTLDAATGEVLYVSPWCEQVFGCPSATLAGSRSAWLERIDPADRPRVEAAFTARATTPDGFDETYRVRRPDGAVRWVRHRAFPIKDRRGKVYRIAAVAEDVTERREADEKLRLSEERFEIATRATNDAIWDWNVLTDELFWNDGFRIFGYEAKDIEPGKNAWSSRVHPADRDRVLAGFQAAIDGPSSYWIDEYRFKRADGSYAAILDRGYVVRDAAGRATRMIGAMMDITERKGAEEALLESEERFRQMAETIREVFWLTEADGLRLLYVSPAIEELTGRSRESILTGSTPWIEIIDPADRERAAAAMRAAAAAGTAFELTYRIVRSDGTTRWVRDRGFPVRTASGAVARYAGIADDISALRRAEEAVRQRDLLYRALIENVQDVVTVLEPDATARARGAARQGPRDPRRAGRGVQNATPTSRWNVMSAEIVTSAPFSRKPASA